LGQFGRRETVVFRVISVSCFLRTDDKPGPGPTFLENMRKDKKKRRKETSDSSLL